MEILVHEVPPDFDVTPVPAVPSQGRRSSEPAATSRGSAVVRVVAVTGEVDLNTAPGMADDIAACLADGAPATVVVDLRRVHFLAAAGLSVLVAADQRAREQHAVLRLLVTTRAVRRVLSVTGLDHTLVLRTELEPTLTD